MFCLYTIPFHHFAHTHTYIHTDTDECSTNNGDGSDQGLYIILQMDWKCYIITLTKILQSSLQPEVYLEMSDSTAIILD